MVDPNMLEHNWKELKGKIRPRWTALTDEDVVSINGKVDTLIELLREKYGYAPAQAEAEVERFMQEAVAPTAVNLT